MSTHYRDTLNVADRQYTYYSLAKACEQHGSPDLQNLPVSLKILLENLLRHHDGATVTDVDIMAMAVWVKQRRSQHEIAYHPARVLMQDFTGVPAVVDLAVMRDAMVALGGDASKINPGCNVDLVIDHSVQVDNFGSADAFKANVDLEMHRNQERYQFLKWGQDTFAHFRVVPPGTGICHQVNLEYLAQVVWKADDDTAEPTVYPDTLVGMDSHTTMINGLGVLGWGVGGIEAEAAMLGQPVTMLIPEVIGFRLDGQLREGITATDLVLTITQMLREKGVVGKLVEFYGPGLSQLPLAERATIANMTPEFGATCGFFPIDDETCRYLELTGRDADQIALVAAYAKAQGLWHNPDLSADTFTDTLALDLASVEPSLAGPRRPQDRVTLTQLPKATDDVIAEVGHAEQADVIATVADADHGLRHGDVVIAAITSCTNTSNPSVLVAAGLLAKNAAARGLTSKPWVKCSLAPGSRVVMDYLNRLDLTPGLEEVGFYLVGFGCTTCIGNSGPLPEPITDAITDNDLMVCSVLSGNRNFAGRVHPLTQANWLASPPLVVAYALAGTTRIDLSTDALGEDAEGNPVYLKDLWPTTQDINAAMTRIDREMFVREYASVFDGDEAWQRLDVIASDTYAWQSDSTYIQKPPFFDGMTQEPPALSDVQGARVLALLGDSITTDHISPAGAIKEDSPAGQYLKAAGVASLNFNSYGSRRGNHDVMMRGTFANIRLRNLMVPGVEGGYTTHVPSGEQLSIYDAAMRYQQEGTPLVVIAGKEYGTGSSRDWAAKGTALLGVKAVVVQSFERIHRSNLIGMGVLPLQFQAGESAESLGLDGTETISIQGIASMTEPGAELQLVIQHADGREQQVTVQSRIDTQDEMNYFRHGGILHYVLRQAC